MSSRESQTCNRHREAAIRAKEECAAGRSRGVTLVELLVVIGIVGVLSGLLLAAVQQAREVARELTCKNRIKQIGLALHIYHDTSRVLPPGWLGHDPVTLRSDPEGVPGWGWAARILPFLEQGDVVRQLVNFDKAILDDSNLRVRTTVLPIYTCPADIRDRFWLLEDEDGGALAKLAKSNYVGVFGTEDVEESPDHGEGVLYHRSHTRFADVHDGLSSTFLVGERSSALGFSTWLGVIPGGEEAMDRIVGICDLPPNPNRNDYDEEGEMDDFSSFHVNGTIFLFVDGSVRWISEGIDPEAYRAMATRAGGEVLVRRGHY